MPTLHLMIGLPCSGKTTYALLLAQETNALLLTPDVWHLRLFGDDIARPDHDRNHDAVEAVMWDVAARVLALGCDVILDFGFWSRQERDDFRQRAAQLGAQCKLHYMDVAPEELLRRLEERNNAGVPGTFVIPQEELKRYMALFQPPTGEELG